MYFCFIYGILNGYCNLCYIYLRFVSNETSSIDKCVFVLLIVKSKNAMLLISNELTFFLVTKKKHTNIELQNHWQSYHKKFQKRFNDRYLYLFIIILCSNKTYVMSYKQQPIY